MKASELRVSLVQGATRWHDAAANRAYYGDLVRRLAGASDLIVLPETFLSGFTNETLGNAESMQGESVRWIGELSREVGAVVTGSLEVELKGWRICPQVCYDLRFPVWLRNRFDSQSQRFDYDLVLFVANWPSPRRHAWSTLLRARAIENLAYAVGVNRVGVDGNQIAYSGDSAAIDFLGQPMIELGAQEQVATVVLDAAALAAHRERFPAWMDADDFRISG